MKQMGAYIMLLVIVFCLTVIGVNRAFSDVEDKLDEFLMEDSVNVWDAFLNTLYKGGLAEPHWKIEPAVQEKLIEYFKMKIDAGVSDGLTSLPLYLPRYVHRFPVEMLQKLRSHAENVLETNPNNGAAAKFLAIEAFSDVNSQKPAEKYSLVNRAVALVPKDIEVCFFAFATCTRFGDRMAGEALVALERLFERLAESDHQVSYLWAMRLYTSEVSATPIQMYLRIDKKDPVINRWEMVLNRILVVFENELHRSPDSGVFNIIAHIHEAMGNIEAAQAVFRGVQPIFEQQLLEDPNSISALSALAGIHAKLGNKELAREYQIKADPTLAWEGQILPDFSFAVDLEGKPISLADYRGKVVLIDFWATWCNPCIAEIPNIKTVYKKYHNEGFEVVGISLDLEEAALRTFVKENELPWRQIFDGKGRESPLKKQYGIGGIPAPFLLDREGKVISVNARGSRLGKLVAAEIERKMD